jgi:hypothetical protein
MLLTCKDDSKYLSFDITINDYKTGDNIPLNIYEKFLKGEIVKHNISDKYVPFILNVSKFE